MIERHRNWIGGAWCEPKSGCWIDVFDPATATKIAEVPSSSTQDIDEAVQHASRAWREWAALHVDQRASILRRVGEGIRKNLDLLAELESLDTGKPVAVARSVDIPRAALNFEFFADAITQFSSECHVQGGSVLHYTMRDPIGVVGAISPWNLPLYLLTWKIAPALAAGNCVVAKPSEVTPLTAVRLGQIALEAGVPPGVLNIVHGGAEAGGALVTHEGVKAVTFTGSSATGAAIAKATTGTFKKLSLEMGGKNASIVFADADLSLAAKEVARAAFTNQGEVCLCGSRILIERAVYTRFKEQLLDATRFYRVGDPKHLDTQVGALVSKQHFAKVMGHLETARAEGGIVLCGGSSVTLKGRCESGFFVEPTLIEGLPPSCRTNQEEIFGPVATLIPFETEEEAIEISNGVKYGLSASVFTSDVSRAHRVPRRLDVGMVWINGWMIRDLRTPFGGTKASGVGREGGIDALRFFTESKNICVRMTSS